MKQIILVIAMALAWAFPMEAAGPEDEIRDVISAQIDAFLADDFDTAFTFASPGIRRVFGSAESFAAMVKSGYPMVWRPAGVRFLELREIDGVPWQKVLVRDGAGAFHVLDYEMAKVGAAWRINGVQHLRRAEIGA